MTDEEYMEMIRQTYSPDTEQHTLFCMVGLVGEAGEVANMCQKAMRGDWDPEQMPEIQKKKLLVELGGVYYFWRALCWTLGVEPAEVLKMNVSKLQARMQRGTIRGDGDDR
jgi:NTP pyrophosphatase (non-canonical NTP hydrolase)